MKIKDLEQILKDKGFVEIRRSKHIIWSNGKTSIAVPHQKEVNKILSKHIIKQATMGILCLGLLGLISCNKSPSQPIPDSGNVSIPVVDSEPVIVPSPVVTKEPVIAPNEPVVESPVIEVIVTVDTVVNVTSEVLLINNDTLVPVKDIKCLKKSPKKCKIKVIKVKKDKKVKKTNKNSKKKGD